MNTLTEQMIEAAAEGTVCEVYGIRFVEESVDSFSTGDVLAPSRVWVDGDPTEELLDGASAVFVTRDEDVEEPKLSKAIAYGSKEGYTGKTILLVGGKRGYSWGEDRKEVVIKDAIVLGAWSL